MQDSEGDRLEGRDRAHAARPVQRDQQRDEPAVGVADEVHRLSGLVDQRLHGEDVQDEMEERARRPRTAASVADEVRSQNAAGGRELLGQAPPLARGEAAAVQQEGRRPAPRLGIAEVSARFSPRGP